MLSHCAASTKPARLRAGDVAVVVQSGAPHGQVPHASTKPTFEHARESAQLLDCDRLIHASTKPALCSAGDARPLRSIDRTIPRFNEAGALQRRR